MASDPALIERLDKWTCNSDGRQAIFTCETMRCRRHMATLIDQGYCFNAGEWNFPDAALRGTYAHKCVYKHVTGWEAFEPALTRAERMDINEIWRCAAEIPEEWYERDHDGLSRLVEALHQRRVIIRDLITAFRRSLRNPFPHWTDGQPHVAQVAGQNLVGDQSCVRQQTLAA